MSQNQKETLVSARTHSDASIHNAEPSSTRDPNREGGLRASLTLLGSFTAFFCTVGFVNAFGVFQEYYVLHQLSSKTPFDISWIGSFSTFILFTGAFPAGLLVDKIGPTIPLIFGSILLLLGVFMTSLCKEYWQFFLAQALLMGLGFSFVLCPALATISKFFKKNRALAMGITIAGSSTGGVVWPILLNNLLNSTNLGFGWTLRIVGFVMMPLLAMSILTIRHPRPEVAQATPSVQEMAEATAEEPVAAGTEEKKQDAAPERPIYKNPNFVLLCSGLGLLYLGFFGPFFFVSSYALSLGESSSFSFYLISILNGASFVGRILPGFLADRYGSWNLLIISSLLSALVAFCWTAATGVAGIVVWSLAYGFASGAIMSLQATCAVSLVTSDKYGMAVGTVMGSVALTGLFGSPICGQLVEHYGYLAISMFTGTAILVGGALIVTARLRLDRRIFVVK